MFPFIATTLALGIVLGIKFSAAAILSGKIALGLSLMPLVGLGLSVVFC